jgi:DNA polymerase III delta prime subunit
MDQQIAFVMKEEILRNTLKTHAVILVTGWPGTGKTATALKAGRDLGDVFYYSSSGAERKSVAVFNDSAMVVDDIDVLSSLQSEQPVLIVDEAQKLSEHALTVVRGLIEKNPENRKIVLISSVVAGVKDLLSRMDAVLRFTQDTAEIMHTRLRDLNPI